MAEREGFEPSIRFCRILTFQASAFDHSATAPHALEGACPRAPRRAVQAVVADAGGWHDRAMLSLLLAALLAPPIQAAPAADPAQPAPGDWRAIPADELLVVTLDGNRRVVIRLAPAFAPVHVANIRRLARARWWDGTGVYRVQDNYVAQWGDVTERKPLPAGVVANPPAEAERGGDAIVTRLARPDSYATRAGHSADGWSVAGDGSRSWLPHCYGSVGVARDLAPSTGSGAELYAVIGHAPRHLDRNIAVVGRVVAGIEHLSSLARGTGELGFLQPPELPTPIVRAQLASDMPEGGRPRFEYRSPGNARFAAYVADRENRRGPFFTVPAGGADLCNIPVPVRAAP